MSSVERIRAGKYTEADVQVLYMKYREKRFHPFVREVGDFLAHNKRDRGATLDTTAFMFGQLAFFQMYQGTNKQPLQTNGSCGWWLRHYLLSKTRITSGKTIKKATGLNKNQAVRAIKSWFPEDSQYPTTIACNQRDLFGAMISVFARVIIGQNVFDTKSARAEISRIFKLEGINQNEIDRFIVATATLLTDKSVEIVPGFIAKTKLSVDNPRHIPVDSKDRAAEDSNARFARLLPDGVLKVMVSTDNQTGDGLIGVALDLIDIETDTELYFDRSLVSLDEHRIPRLDLDRKLSFDASRPLPVHSLQ